MCKGDRHRQGLALALLPLLIFHHGSTVRGIDPTIFANRYEPKPLIECSPRAAGPWCWRRGAARPRRLGGRYDEGFSIDRTRSDSSTACTINAGLFNQGAGFAAYRGRHGLSSLLGLWTPTVETYLAERSLSSR